MCACVCVCIYKQDLALNNIKWLIYQPKHHLARLAGAVEYTDCTSAEGLTLTPQRVSWYDTKQSDDEVLVMLELCGMQSTPSLPLVPGSLWPGVVTPDGARAMGLIELNCMLMLNWIVWIRTVWLNWITWSKYFWQLNCTYILNCVLMLNWIIWNWTVSDIELYLHKTELFKIELFWHLTMCKQNLYSYQTKLAELEQFE